jgi:hypothetical protein
MLSSGHHWHIQQHFPGMLNTHGENLVLLPIWSKHGVIGTYCDVDCDV